MVPTYFGTKMTRVRGTAPRLPYCLYDGPRPMARRPRTSACRPKPEAPRSMNPSRFTGGRAPSPGRRGWRGRQASAPALAPGPQARTLHGLRERRTAFQGPGPRVCGQARGQSEGSGVPSVSLHAEHGAVFPSGLAVAVTLRGGGGHQASPPGPAVLSAGRLRQASPSFGKETHSMPIARGSSPSTQRL